MRGVVFRSLARSVGLAALLLLAYSVLPLRATGGVALAWLVGGLVVVAVGFGWQVRTVAVDPHPRLRAIGALVIGVPAVLVVFATTYLLMAGADPAAFSEPLDRTDALYFATSVLSTVGFGDVVPVSTAARAVTTAQMVLDLVLLGLAVRVLVGAVESGLRRRAGEHPDRS